MVDYTAASATYDNTRSPDDIVIDYFAQRFSFSPKSRFLDFGCGTGNYLRNIADRFGSRGCGIEPSDGMRERAIEKNPESDIRKGSHEDIGFPDKAFEFIYLTDVIHHIPDLSVLFATMSAKLETGGLVCILTESHAQIASRWYNRYFPSLCANECSRYPDISVVCKAAQTAGFSVLAPDLKKHEPENIVTELFIRMVREKNYSMFTLLESEEYTRGLASLEQAEGKTVLSEGHGETLLWFKKKEIK